MHFLSRIAYEALVYIEGWDCTSFPCSDDACHQSVTSTASLLPEDKDDDLSPLTLNSNQDCEKSFKQDCETTRRKHTLVTIAEETPFSVELIYDAKQHGVNDNILQKGYSVTREIKNAMDNMLKPVIREIKNAKEDMLKPLRNEWDSCSGGDDSTCGAEGDRTVSTVAPTRTVAFQYPWFYNRTESTVVFQCPGFYISIGK